MAHLDREGVTFAEFEQWRLALEEGSRTSVGTGRQIRKLERELARKEKALAEGAALLILKKRSRAATRLADRLYLFESLDDSGFKAELPVDECGVVLDYPDLFRRVIENG